MPAAVHDYFCELAAILAKPGPPDTAAIEDRRRRYATEQVSALSASWTRAEWTNAIVGAGHAGEALAAY